MPKPLQVFLIIVSFLIAVFSIIEVVHNKGSICQQALWGIFFGSSLMNVRKGITNLKNR